MAIAKLERAVFRLSGENVLSWLEGLITNTIAEHGLTFAALLTPQGKIIADFFISRDGEALVLDTPQKFSADLYKRLRMYKLRAPIEIEDLSATHAIYAVWDGKGEEGHADPRLPALGFRLITDEDLPTTGDYNAHRLSLGMTDSVWDFETATTFPADANMDLINGVDFKKGCFVGQEVVSRMKRMTTVKKRFRAVVFEGSGKAGDKIMTGERVIGELLSVHNKMAMAMIRLDRMSAAETSPTVNGERADIMRGPDGER